MTAVRATDIAAQLGKNQATVDALRRLLDELEERSRENIELLMLARGVAARSDSGSKVDDQTIASRLLDNGSNVHKTARELRVSPNRVSRLRDRLRLPRNAKQGPRTTGDRSQEREAVKARLAAGESLKRTSRETDIPESTVRRWRNEWRAVGIL